MKGYVTEGIFIFGAAAMASGFYLDIIQKRTDKGMKIFGVGVAGILFLLWL